MSRCLRIFSITLILNLGNDNFISLKALHDTPAILGAVAGVTITPLHHDRSTHCFV
jgi:hypothetical protein